MVAACQECIAYVPQVDSVEEGNAAQGNSASACHVIEGNLAYIVSTSQTARNKGKRCRCASSASIYGNLSNICGPKAAGAISRPKGKQVQKAPPEVDTYRPPQEGRDPDEKPRTFSGVHI